MTPKQSKFVDEYLIDLNASAAARRAGYSERTAEWIGPRLVTKSHVAAAIAARRAAISDKAERSVLDVLADIGRVRESAMTLVLDPMTGAYTMRSHKDALKALELEGKHLGAFEADNTQRKTQVTVTGFVMLPDE